MTEYIISSSAWSIGGLVVGYMIGRMELRAKRRRELHDRDPARHQD